MTEFMPISQDSELYQAERELRNRVLLRPIGLPDFAWEMKDPESHHLGLVSGDGELLACVLLWPDDSGGAKLLQMAVDQEHQGQGFGATLLEETLAFARSCGLGQLWCHARANVTGFYAQFGFQIEGPAFEEVGLQHFRMSLPL